MNKTQWNRIYRKLRVRRHIVTGQRLWAEGMAMLNTIHEEISASMSAKATAETMLQDCTTHTKSAHSLT